MIVELKPEDELLVQKQLRSGAFASAEEIIHYALESLDQDEAWLHENKGAIHEKIGQGIAELDRGEGLSARDARTRLQEQKAAWLARQRR
jgi:Arc/MetJ-type ribon-helix-helix transcriptional regulator